VGTGIVARAVGLFVATNVDDIVLLALFFARAGRDRAAELRIVAGQYLGLVAIVAAALAGAAGANLLPESAVPWLGLVPLLIGIHSGWEAWRERRQRDGDDDTRTVPRRPGIGRVAAVTLANGGDNIGVYVPVFAVASAASIATYVVVFLVGVAGLCALGRYLATRQAIGRLLERWGHVLTPVVLIVVGVAVLAEVLR
jgi:cadmium resistance protein CadD (predicted permease)